MRTAKLAFFSSKLVSVAVFNLAFFSLSLAIRKPRSHADSIGGTGGAYPGGGGGGNGAPSGCTRAFSISRMSLTGAPAGGAVGAPSLLAGLPLGAAP